MKIIHTADIHLGAQPDLGFPWSRQRGQDIWDTFRRLVAQTRAEQADFLLISGDLFHRQPLLRELKEVNYLFSTIPDTTVVLMAGNHDYLKRDSYYPGFSWEKNVIGLWSEACEKISVPGKHTAVYGCSYHQREIRNNLYAGLRPEGEEVFHLLLAHGGDASHSPLDLKELAGAGFTYTALGHIHRPRIFQRGRMAYSGALEPIDRGDEGPHGYMRVECRQDSVYGEFVPFASRSYMTLDIPVTEKTTQFALEEQCAEGIRRAGEQNLFRLRLTGTRDPRTEISAEALARTGKVTEILDETRPGWDLEELSRIYQGTLIGAYVDHFRGKNAPVEQKALFYGVEALMEARRDL